MKKNLSIIVILGLTGCLTVCKGPSPKIPSVEETSFDAVTSQLDTGGSLYLYLSTEKMAQAVEDLADKGRTIIESQETGSESKKEEILGIYDFVVDFIKKTGMSDISGIGMSSVAMDEKLNHSKLVVHHYKGQGSGILWQMWDEKPHDLAALNLLPADTVLAQFSDWRLSRLWQIIKDEANASGIDKLKEGVESLVQILAKQGISLDDLLESLGGDSGFLLTLDSAKKATIPLGPMPLEIPEPGLAIVLGIKDDTLFNLLESKMPFAEKSEEDGIKKLKIPVPPMPVPLQPEVVYSGNHLIIASHSSVTEAMFAAREQGDGLVATEEFKELSKNVPGKGNAFRFMGSRFFQQIVDIQKRAAQASGEVKEGELNPAEILNMFWKGMTWYGVLQNTDEGLVYTFNHSLDLEYAALLSATGAVGIATALIIPNLRSMKKKQHPPWEEEGALEIK